MKVAFIGLGNMGASLAKAVAKEVDAQDLLLFPLATVVLIA